MDKIKKLRDWSARTQGYMNWDDACGIDDFWLGARIGFIFANILLSPFWVFLIWLLVK